MGIVCWSWWKAHGTREGVIGTERGEPGRRGRSHVGMGVAGRYKPAPCLQVPNTAVWRWRSATMGQSVAAPVSERPVAALRRSAGCRSPTLPSSAGAYRPVSRWQRWVTGASARCGVAVDWTRAP